MRLTNGDEINRDNVQKLSEDALIRDKELLSTANVNINEARILEKLIDVELLKRKTERDIETIAKLAREQILEGY